MANLSLKHIDKIYDNNVQAVFDFNPEIADKEFIVFVGPSGCGKSTTMPYSDFITEKFRTFLGIGNQRFLF